MKKKSFSFKVNTFLIVLGLILSSCSLFQSSKTTRTYASGGRTLVETPHAYEAYNLLRRAQFTHTDIGLRVRNSDPEVNGGVVSYGGEKEGSSARLTKVMGPSSEHFKNTVENLDESGQRQFLIGFMNHLATKGRKTVTKNDGESITLSHREYKQTDWNRASLDELKAAFNDWVDQTENNPFSFLSQKIRRQIYNGNFPGLSPPNETFKNFRDTWVPLFGESEKYIQKAVNLNTIKGWEIITNPQFSYGEHEAMIKWFRRTLGTSQQLFEAPGHQRILWPKPNLSGEALQEFNAKLAATHRLAQALVVLKGVAGNTGINFGHWKFMLSDSDIRGLNVRRNDIFRLEQNRFVQGSMAVEMRAGTKDFAIQRFIQQMISARVASQDFSGIEGIDDWELIPRGMTAGGFPRAYNFDSHLPPVDSVAEKYGASAESVKNAFENIKRIKRTSTNLSGDLDLFIRYEFWIPFWQWEQAPFLSDEKKSLLKTLTKNFIENMASMENPTQEKVQRLFQDWVRVSEIDNDIENVLKPRRLLEEDAKPHNLKLAEGRRVDVNRIDLGIEYSAHYPLDNKLIFTDEQFTDGKKHWLMTTYDLSDQEREDVIRNYAENLARQLGIENPQVYKVDGVDEHGHAISLAYAFKDNRGREWRAEWDGIGRTYSKRSERVLRSSKRGGHIEVVTPKFKPHYHEMKAVYQAFDQSNLVPSYKAGGSHININLASFRGKPREMARFLAVFHQYRSLIALMYQHPGRRAMAEPVALEADLARQLANFDGTELELKQLLYNSQYFNNRVGRKSRYVQLDVSSYFQDVIPDQMVSADFDIGNPWIPWRRQFRVNPKIRKAEFRLFGAPESAYEGALQVKLVRALLNKAFNDNTPLNGSVQNISHEEYFNDPKKAYDDLDRMARELGLDPTEYEMSLSRGIEETEKYMKSEFYQTVDEKLAVHPRVNGWGQALEEPRSAAKTAELKDRKLRPSEIEVDSAVRQLMDRKQRSAIRAFDLRESITERQLRNSGNIIRQGGIRRIGSCTSLVRSILFK